MSRIVSDSNLKAFAQMADSLSRQNAIFANLSQVFSYKPPFDTVKAARTLLGSSLTSDLTGLVADAQRTLTASQSHVFTGLASNVRSTLSLSACGAFESLSAFQLKSLTKLTREFEQLQTLGKLGEYFLRQGREQAAWYRAYQSSTSEYRSKQFTTAIEAHAPLLLHIAWRIVRNYEDAQDIVQDTCEKAWKSLQDLSQAQKIKEWLCRITYTTALNYRRQQQWLAPLDVDWLSHQPGGRFDQPEAFLIRSELIRALDAALQTLPPIQRKTILLRFLAKEYSLAEIADCLSCKVGTVKSNLSRGLCTLRRHLCQQDIQTHDIEGMIDILIPGGCSGWLQHLPREKTTHGQQVY